jgi:hypothetical protein
MTTQDTIADTIALSQTLITRYFAGFNNTNHTLQPFGLPNHFAWTLGHLAYIMQRAAEKIDDQPPPPSDFILSGSSGGAAGGTGVPPVSGAPATPPTRFTSAAVSFGSTPVNDPAQYPTTARSLEIFNTACARLIAATRAASDDKLRQASKWGAADLPIRDIILRMPFHNGTHAGQLADIRRALGFKSIFA